VVRSSGQHWFRIALAGALFAALGVSGCGRKTGLDPPAAAVATAPDGTVQPTAPQGGGLDPYGRPVAAPPGAQKKSIFLDWLVD
jgi:predicted small lipoprotein YifL